MVARHNSDVSQAIGRFGGGAAVHDHLLRQTFNQRWSRGDDDAAFSPVFSCNFAYLAVSAGPRLFSRQLFPQPEIGWLGLVCERRRGFGDNWVKNDAPSPFECFLGR